jgi:hypothetical protein
MYLGGLFMEWNKVKDIKNSMDRLVDEQNVVIYCGGCLVEFDSTGVDTMGNAVITLAPKESSGAGVMTIKELFTAFEKRAELLEANISKEIEGNSGDNRFYYDKNTRDSMQKELYVIRNTMDFIDHQASTFELKL